MTEERLRIARELHDVVAHNVSLMVVQAQALAATGAGRPAARPRRSGESRTSAARRCRRCTACSGCSGSRTAPAPEREPQPGVRDLERLIARTHEAGSMASLVIGAALASCRPGVDLSAYRIVQEALTNVIRHAGAHQRHR